jgi:hypothetical protein
MLHILSVRRSSGPLRDRVKSRQSRARPGDGSNWRHGPDIRPRSGNLLVAIFGFATLRSSQSIGCVIWCWRNPLGP